MSTNFESIVKEAFQVSAKNLTQLAESGSVIQSLVKAAEMAVDSYKKGGCILACGNGGSAADAQHFIAELVSKLSKDRTPIKGIALTVDTSILTAIGNDYGYEWSFHRQVMALMNKNDILLAITTSGNSPNVLRALEACREVGGKSILLAGRDGGKAAALADHSIIAPGAHTGNIQEGHLVIYHTLCYLIERGLIDAGLCKYQETYPV
jgi:D-sedoheptulose 7-phosphate isomerase